ncbi:MAG: type II toxin-antitoxin system HicA family toxin [Chloroflexi bacterium]|nr:type II toxin-antitoxin system HicA family toxin [Chloroflexota bacterium]
MKHSIKRNLSVTVPVHSKDLPEKTLRRIIKQANLSEADFLKLISD